MGNFELLAAMVRNIGSTGLNRNMTGYSFSEETGPVEREHITMYAAATCDPNPAYGGADPVAPPFFIARLMIPMLKKLLCRRDLNMNILKMVHAFQEIVWHSPIRAGMRLKLTMGIERIYDTPAGELVEISLRGFCGSDILVEGISGLIIRKRSKGRRPAEAFEKPKERFRLHLTTSRKQPAAYAAASLDNNPIHTANLVARAAGLPGAIMHGACVMAMGCSALTREVKGNDLSRLAAVRGRFSFPALPGRSLFVVGYETCDEGILPFEVLDKEGRSIIRDGILRFR